MSVWKFKKAKDHTVSIGCGMAFTVENKTRNRIDEDKLEHFIDYIVSSDIVKDLPYGSKNMKLSSGEIVIRSLGPSSLIEQYNQLCEAEDIKPLGNK